MELFQREHILSRILAGYLKYRVGDDELRICNPSLDIIYDSNQIYIDTYNKCLGYEILDDKGIYNLLIEKSLWTETNEQQLIDILPKHIEYWKIEMYKAMFRSVEREKFRKYLNVAKQELQRLHTIRHSFDHATCGGIANYAKIQYVVENSTLTKDNQKYYWDKSSPYLAMVFYQDNIISEDTLRELGHTAPWDTIWSAGKKNGRLFPKSGIELSSEQQRLIMWSSLYDNIREYPDCPSDETINDDDVFDGWLLIKKREREAESNKISVEGNITNPKIANSDEIYLVANTIDDAKKIDAMNTSLARSIKKQRFDYITKHGEVKEQSLPDMKQRFSIELTQAMMKGTKNGR